MIFKNQRTFFKKEIIKITKEIRRKNGVFLDFTYGTGKISKIIKNNIYKENLLISYDFNRFLRNTLSKGNFFFYNICFSSFKNLVFTGKINFSIIDMGYSDNELINNYFDSKSINEFINFSSYKRIKKILNLKSDFFIRYIKNVKLKGGMFLLKNFLLEYRNRDKKKILFYFRNFMYSFKNKINELLKYLLFLMKKNSYIVFICFNSYESKIVKKFYKRNIIHFSYNKIVKRINKKTIVVLRILKKNDNSI
ncbi:Ribosomal RNA small subunit methyltransferase H [Candidatus Vidania fulgoroideae]|nr:Ribosomal RNA small subunit methyltransferase H [Candidatus Vidania fulgoroideae]